MHSRYPEIWATEDAKEKPHAVMIQKEHITKNNLGAAPVKAKDE